MINKNCTYIYPQVKSVIARYGADNLRVYVDKINIYFYYPVVLMHTETETDVIIYVVVDTLSNNKLIKLTYYTTFCLYFNVLLFYDRIL